MISENAIARFSVIGLSQIRFSCMDSTCCTITLELHFKQGKRYIYVCLLLYLVTLVIVHCVPECSPLWLWDQVPSRWSECWATFHELPIPTAKSLHVRVETWNSKLSVNDHYHLSMKLKKPKSSDDSKFKRKDDEKYVSLSLDRSFDITPPPTRSTWFLWPIGTLSFSFTLSPSFFPTWFSSPST